MTYETISTPAGLAELADAQLKQQPVPFTHIALGDGNGAPVDPTGRTGLVREVDRVQVTSIVKHPNNPNVLIVEAAVTEERGGYTVRELALIGGRAGGIVLAVGNYPATEKPILGDGSARAIIVRMAVSFANASVVSLQVDPMAYVTAAYVLQQIAAHEAKADPHPQYLTKAEADAFYDSIGLAADAIQQDAARLSAHVAAADPHTQYLTKTEADARGLDGRAERFFLTSF